MGPGFLNQVPTLNIRIASSWEGDRSAVQARSWFDAMAQALESALLSNQGEKSINFYFIRVPLRKKVLKYGTPKPRSLV